MVRGGGEIRRKIAVALGASVIMLLMTAQPASAAILTGSISDAQGDANRWVNKNKAIPAYLDIKGASLTLDTETGTFTLTMEMYGEVPDKPVLFNGIHTLLWQWAIDVEGGPYPYSHWMYQYEEYTVSVMWDGKAWCAQLWDCSGMQEPGNWLVRDIENFDRLDNGFEVTVPSSWMNNIQACKWVAADNGFMSPLDVSDSYAWWFFDFAGVDFGEFVDWPAT